MQTQWNLSLILSDDSQIQTDLNAVKAAVDAFVAKWKDRQDYLTTPSVLAQALADFEKLNKEHGLSGRAGYYLWLKTRLNESDTELKAKFNKMTEFAQELENSIMFFTLNISKIDPIEQTKFLQSPDLAEFKHFLEQLFAEAKFLLTESEEKILSIKSKTSHSNWEDMLSSFLSKSSAQVLDESEAQTEKTFSEILTLMSSKNKKVRDKSALEFNKILEHYAEVAESEINSILESKRDNDKLRKVERPDILRHLSDDIETDVVDTLVTTVTEHFDLSQEYYALKAKVLGVDKLEYHERNLEVGELNKSFSFEEAAQIVSRTFKKLDPAFDNFLQGYLENGQIDVYPKKGKSDGAFCAHDLQSLPIYILLNFGGRLNDVRTFAHEMGHAIHFEYTKEQNALNDGASTATAEVASTFMEDFVLHDVASTLSEKEQFTILMSKLNDDVSTIQRQIGIYNFERELHSDFREKGYLSKKDIGELFLKNMGLYLGDSVSLSAGSQNWWMYISHIRSFFYVYSYASGALISKSLQQQVYLDPKNIENVKDYFRAGTSSAPKEIFAKLGIDITKKAFWEEGLKRMREDLKKAREIAGE